MRNATKMETAYTYSEWCKLVDRHGKTILKRYIKRKLRTATRFIFRVLVLYLAYAFCYAVAYQL